MVKDTLQTYRQKRNFKVTEEPSGQRRKPAKGDSFVVQKHAARRLHYDFRLELDGVLKSWAVTRGPSYNTRDKRLAVRTEDHPLDYAHFEGTIPEGEYGAGAVIVWDNGRWAPHQDPHEGLAKGKLSFDLYGQRMHGKWSLVRMARDKTGKGKENWLLLKEIDDFANDEVGETLLDIFPTSIVSGRTIDDIANGAKASAAKAEAPAFVKPQLADLYDAPPEGAGWLHEIKFDGYRIVAVKKGDAVRFYTRTGLDWTAKFAALTPAIAALPCESAVIDGEITVLGPQQRTDFSALQAALSEGKGDFIYYVFDLLHLDGRNLRDLPLRERKARLKVLTSASRKASRLLYSDHFEGQGAAFHAKAGEMGLEGIVSKDAAAPYRSGRSASWRKIKCANEQEFVIVGYSESDKKGRAFSSLLVGYYDDAGALTYAGRVGTGFTETTLDTLGKRLKALRLPKRPDLNKLVHRSDAVYVKPELVAQVGFIGWTADDVIRHAVFKGLRQDKRAKAVKKEVAAMAKTSEAGGAARFAGVRLTHPEKLLFPGEGITKQDIADYYLRVAGRMLPYIEDRLVSLVRCPQGTGPDCFFQRHASQGFPKAFSRLTVKESEGGEEEYIYLKDVSGLVSAAQIGALELHIWGSRIKSVEKPDRIVFDLDPDEGLGFSDLKKAALHVRDLLESIGLRAFVMATGGKGLHLVCPVLPKHEWPQVKAFTRAIAETLAAQWPERYTANIRKASRKGRIFVDYLRNDRTATAICPYSTRNKPGAPIAIPLAWEALTSLKSAHPVTVRDASALDRLLPDDPWRDYFSVKQTLPISKLLGGGSRAGTERKKKR